LLGCSWQPLTWKLAACGQILLHLDLGHAPCTVLRAQRANIVTSCTSRNVSSAVNKNNNKKHWNVAVST